MTHDDDTIPADEKLESKAERRVAAAALEASHCAAAAAAAAAASCASSSACCAALTAMCSRAVASLCLSRNVQRIEADVRSAELLVPEDCVIRSQASERRDARLMRAWTCGGA